MLRPSGLALGLTAGLLWACGPNPHPAKVMALVPNAQGTLAPAEVTLETITDLPTLEGKVTHFVGGATVVIDPDDPAQTSAIATCSGPQPDAATKKACFEAFAQSTGGSVRLSLVENEGRLWPADFHSWNLATAAYNFERSFRYYQSVFMGAEPTELEGLRILYWGDLRVASPAWMVDNELFFAIIQSFELAPAKDVQGIPLAMSAAITGHEMGHRVFNHQVLKDYGAHPVYSAWDYGPLNLLKSLDEGFADFHGYGVSCGEPSGCQPAFLTRYFDDATAAARDLSNPQRCATTLMLANLSSASLGQWIATDMYRYGTVWASALYQGAAHGKAGNAYGELQAGLIAAYPDLGALLESSYATGASGNFNPEAVAEVILSHLTDPDLQTKLCSELLTRLKLKCTTGGSTHCAEMPHCPAASAADPTVCEGAP
jgi:hypothetical protein